MITLVSLGVSAADSGGTKTLMWVLMIADRLEPSATCVSFANMDAFLKAWLISLHSFIALAATCCDFLEDLVDDFWALTRTTRSLAWS